MKLRWLASVSASALYASAELLRGRPLLDASLVEALAEPLEVFRSACEGAGVDPVLVVDHLTALSVEQSAVADQARMALRKLGGEALAARLASVVNNFSQQVQNAFDRCFPNTLHELELRSLPLREQWEARGPGLWKVLGRYLGPDALAESADSILVRPVTGGGGAAHVPYNRVSFEAVLANPEGELPEVMRLGWLLAQLQLDLPAIQGNLSRPRALVVGALGLVPALLTASHEVELTGPTERLLPRALETWRLDSGDAETLSAWWDTFVANQLPWGTALAALDQMLPP